MTYEEAKKSMQRSMRWAKRSKDAFVDRDGYGIFGIQQGSVFEDLRQESANELTKIGFDGYAIGGLAVGEGQEKMFEVLDYAPSMLPEDKPRYLMGVGDPIDILEGVERGRESRRPVRTLTPGQLQKQRAIEKNKNIF